MSSHFHVRTPRPSVRSFSVRVAAAALAAAGALAIVAGAPAPAQAAVASCKGAPTEVQGSSLQKAAQEFWRSSNVYKSENPEAFGCGADAPEVTYTSKSSGCGLDAMGAGIHAEGCNLAGGESAWEQAGYRDASVGIGATDFPPDKTEEKNIDDGQTTSGNSDAGQIHVIPVASAAIAVVVHFPEGCTLKTPGTGTAASGVGSINDDATTGGVNDPAGEATGDTAEDETLRVHIPAPALEEIWEHKITEWGNIPTPANGGRLSGEMEGTPTGADAGDTCANAPIYRIARFDTSGTTYNFKAYLSLLPSSKEDGGLKLWREGEVGSDNTAWPLESAEKTGIPAEVGTEKQVKEKEDIKNEKGEGIVPTVINGCTAEISMNHICRANAEGGGSLSSAVIATDGSIGYLDLATAREKGYTITEKKKDDTYWLPLQAISPSAATPSERIVNPLVFYEPTETPAAHLDEESGKEVIAAKGADCAEADYRGIPTAAESPDDEPTFGNWENAIATGGGKYPVCAITYDLAFDDYAPVFGDTPAVEAEAETVKNYMTAVTSEYGQVHLSLYDYGLLPRTIREDAEKGVASIGFDKSAGSSGSKEETKAKPVEAIKSSGGGSTVTAPSSSFSISGVKVKSKKVVVSLVLPGAGAISVKATGGGVTVGSASASVSGGQGTVSLSISKAAAKKLATAKKGELSVTVSVTFTPTGGSAASHTKTLTLTASEAGVKATKKASTKKKKSKKSKKSKKKKK